MSTSLPSSDLGAAQEFPDPQPVTLIIVPWGKGVDFLCIARWDVWIYPRASTGGPCPFATAFNSRALALDKLKYIMMCEIGRHFTWELTEVQG